MAAPPLVGRRRECARLDELLAAARAGHSRVLVVRGGPGTGKTALLRFLTDRAGACRIVRAGGARSERNLGYAALHQLCLPHLERLAGLPARQRETLEVAFGLSAGQPPDPWLAGRAVQTLMTEVAREGPLLLVVDDAQWLDDASAAALRSMAHRLAAGPVGLVVAVRDPAGAWPRGLPELAVSRLDSHDAAVLLDRTLAGVPDPRVLARLLAESDGNPLALLAAARAVPMPELASMGAGPPTGRLEREFERRVGALPGPARRLLLLAAAEPAGDVAVLRRAAQRIGSAWPPAVAAECGGLLSVAGPRVLFQHPLVRSAVYRSAAPAERRAAHRALAEVTDPHREPDRRAWHHARAAVRPDEAVAADLERSAGRALAHGGLGAAATFLERAAALTPEPARRARRCLAAARTKLRAGALVQAAQLAASARAGPLDETGRLLIERLEAEVAVATGRDGDAVARLLAVARRWETVDARTARDMYLEALAAVLLTGRAGSGAPACDVVRAARAAPPAGTPAGHALLETLGALLTEGPRHAALRWREAVGTLARPEQDLESALRCTGLAAAAAAGLWDDAGWDLLSRRHLETARRAGALGVLPRALHARAVMRVFAGETAQAATLIHEADRLGPESGGLVPCGAMILESVRGSAHGRSSPDTGTDAPMRDLAQALLSNAHGRYPEALRAARRAAEDRSPVGPPQWALAEVVEAGARIGATRAAREALDQLSDMAHAAGTDWALGILAGRRALIAGDADAEDDYREAVERLGRTRLRLDLAREQLRYGEWLRRQARRRHALDQLRTAHAAFAAMGAGPFAERARHELLAAGGGPRRDAGPASAVLTAQETHIARLAAQGLTNGEIGAALSISARTVEWHLGTIYIKLRVPARGRLRLALAEMDAGER
ncbi:LuxR family transcriptional regulator [Actinoplanes sp. NPDC048796]|uniref:ATP-binding protein n=1 Tax=Actinoplanes sp. NPDC048796 TaxID=3155640 RepID=UPI0033EDF85A